MNQSHRMFGRRNVVGLAGVLLGVTLPCMALATPTILTDPTSGFNWNGHVNRNALRFRDTGAEDLIHQDGSDDPWVMDGLWATSFDDFDFGIWNKDRHGGFDGLILMISYRGTAEDDFSFWLTSDGDHPMELSRSDFGDPSAYSIVGHKPVNQPTLSTTEGIVFIDLGENSALANSDGEVGGDDTLDLSFDDFDDRGVAENFALLFDVYGYVEGHSPDIITDRNPNSSDLVGTGEEPVPEASTMILFGSGLAGLLGVARRKGWFGIGR